MEENKPSAPLPPLQDAGLERYMLRGRSQIVQIMQELIDNRCLMSAYVSGGVSFVSALLRVLPEDGAVLLDASPDPAIHARVLDAGRLLCTTQVNRIRIQFSVQELSETMDGGRPALRARLPAEVLRLQRRECYRLQVPLAHMVTLSLPQQVTGADGTACEARVLDISGSGIAAQLPAGGRELTIGEVLGGCTLRLADREPLTVAVEIRNINHQLKPNGTEQLRVGMRFETLSKGTETRIQRYVFNTEREINARTRGGL